MAVSPPDRMSGDPSVQGSERLQSVSGSVCCHLERGHLCPSVLHGRAPALASPFCLISFCFEQTGEPRAAGSFQGLGLVAGAG